MRIAVVFLPVALNFLLGYIHANQPVTVSTKYGDILGYETSIARVFYGIPFAEPPINDLRYVDASSKNHFDYPIAKMNRWNPPVPISKWSPKVWNATFRAPGCPQTGCGNPPSFLCPPIVNIHAICFSATA